MTMVLAFFNQLKYSAPKSLLEYPPLGSSQEPSEERKRSVSSRRRRAGRNNEREQADNSRGEKTVSSENGDCRVSRSTPTPPQVKGGGGLPKFG
jgi:hypothetical protein